MFPIAEQNCRFANKRKVPLEKCTPRNRACPRMTGFLRACLARLLSSKSPPAPSPCCGPFTLISKPLLETSLGWLEVRDILAARTVCRAWSCAQACCPVCLTDLPCVRAETVRDLRLDRPRNVDLSRFKNLERLSLFEPDGVLVCPKNFRAQVHIFCLKTSLEFSPLTQHLHTLEYTHWSTSHVQNSLTEMLTLPRLTRLVLHKARGLAGTRASPTSRLQELVLVDCACEGISLAFMDDLPQLSSLGLVQKDRPIGVLPTDVPERTRARIQRLEIQSWYLVWYRVRDEVHVVSLAGYSSLRWLHVSSKEVVISKPVAHLVCEIQQLTGLETLRIDANLPCLDWLGAGLTSLDLAHDQWCHLSEIPERLCELSLRDHVGGLTELTRCLFLRKVRLVRSSHIWKETGVRFLVCLPPGLELLELAGLRPCCEIQVPTLYIDSASFKLLDANEQARLKAGVANLYVRDSTRTPRGRYRYFESSFVSDSE